MALARVQSIGGNTVAASITLTFASPPTVGNGIAVAVNVWWTLGPTIPTCTDNRGNTYSTATTSLVGVQGLAIFYCPIITGTGSPFTITLSGMGFGTSSVAAAVEVSGVGLGLVLDGSASASGVSATPATGNTGTLTVNDIFVIATHHIITDQASITVASVSPAWTEETEHLTALAGEVDSRILTTASGTTTSASWTDITSQSWRATLAAFRASAAAASIRVTQDAIEVLSQPVPAARIGQYSVEVLSATTPVPGRITQYSVEVLSSNLVVSAGTETTQFFVIMP